MAAKSLEAGSVAALSVEFDSEPGLGRAGTASSDMTEVFSVLDARVTSRPDPKSSKVSISLSATIRSPLEAAGLFQASN